MLMMLFAQATFIGIDPTAGERPFTYAAIDQDQKLLALGEGSMQDILAFLAGQQIALAAICGPRQPNQGLMAKLEIRSQQTPPPQPGRWENFRLAEYQLRQHHLNIPQTPARVEHCSNWVRNAFTLFTRLADFGYQVYPADEAPRQSLEAYPHAGFAVLLGLLPFYKHSLEGRIQRQLVLQEVGMQVPDAMRLFEEITRHRLLSGRLPLESLYSPSELDALVGAHIAWKAARHPAQVCRMGDPVEGEILLPVAEIKSIYR